MIIQIGGAGMKRVALCILAVILFISVATAGFAASSPYMGNKDSKVYHTADCSHGQKTAPENRVYFYSRESAESSGYRRCHFCGDDIVEPGHGGGSSSNKNPSSNSGTTQQGSQINSQSQQSGGSQAGENKPNKLGPGMNVFLFCIVAFCFGFLTAWFVTKTISAVNEEEETRGKCFAVVWIAALIVINVIPLALTKYRPMLELQMPYKGAVWGNLIALVFCCFVLSAAFGSMAAGISLVATMIIEMIRYPGKDLRFAYVPGMRACAVGSYLVESTFVSIWAMLSMFGTVELSFWSRLSQ